MNNQEIVQQELQKKKESFHPVNLNMTFPTLYYHQTWINIYVYLSYLKKKTKHKELLRKQRALIIPYNGNASHCGVNGWEKEVIPTLLD